MGILSSSHAEKLKLIRKAEGMTQSAFSAELGLGLSTVRNYESGQREVGLSIVDKVANHPKFEKYTLWLMTDKTMERAGQISPALSPNGPKRELKNQKDQKVG
ncbi:helix-turn-helix transcriptional regulator [Rahnella aquatilis]|nr:helix-turn-helix transcriptional regulator [Rahnella aquatilis]